MAPPLNHKQKKFALEYRIDHNGTQAALRAGYSHRGVETQAGRLLADVRIRKLIEEHDTKVLKEVEAKGNRVLEELAHFAHSDLKDAFRDDGTLLPIHEMPEHIRRAIKSFEVEELWADNPGAGDGEPRKLKVGRTVKLTLWPKDRGLELLGKNQKLFTDKVEVGADASLAELLAAARSTREDGE